MLLLLKEGEGAFVFAANVIWRNVERLASSNMFLCNCYVNAYFGKTIRFCLEILQNLECAICPFILLFFCDFRMVPQEIFNTCAVLSAPKQSLGEAVSCLCTRFSHTWALQAPNQSTKTRLLDLPYFIEQQQYVKYIPIRKMFSRHRRWCK